MFIITTFGTPSLSDTLDDSEPLNTLQVMRREWRQCSAFDAHQRYRCYPSHHPQLGPFRKLLAYLVYNPKTDVTFHWEPVGAYVLSDIVADVERGLQMDDDGIQQWFGADDILRLLRAATTFEEMKDVVRCIFGEFERDSRLRAFVDRVLGSSPASSQA